MHLWSEAYDALSAAERLLEPERVRTPEQQLKIAEIKALLAIGQELSLIHHQGINPIYSAE